MMINKALLKTEIGLIVYTCVHMIDAQLFHNDNCKCLFLPFAKRIFFQRNIYFGFLLYFKLQVKYTYKDFNFTRLENAVCGISFIWFHCRYLKENEIQLVSVLSLICHWYIRKMQSAFKLWQQVSRLIDTTISIILSRYFVYTIYLDDLI